MTFTFTKTPTSLKSSTLLLFAQNSSKLFICSNPGIRSHVGTERINLVCLQKKSPERSAILLLAISMVCRLFFSKPLKILTRSSTKDAIKVSWKVKKTKTKWTETSLLSKRYPTSSKWDRCQPRRAPLGLAVYPDHPTLWFGLPKKHIFSLFQDQKFSHKGTMYCLVC